MNKTHENRTGLRVGPWLGLLLLALMLLGWGQTGDVSPAAPSSSPPVQVARPLDQPALPVSTAEAQRTLEELNATYRHETAGKVADHNEVAAAADPTEFGIAVMGVDGQMISTGETDTVFSLQSMSKAFVFGLALADNGGQAMLEKVGVHATGLPYGSLAATEVRATRLQNPMVSSGAIAVTSTIAGATSQERWGRTQGFLGALAGRKVIPIKKVYAAETTDNAGSLAKAWALYQYGLLYCEPDDAVARYLRACAVGVTVEELATMGATLANSGVNPRTGKRVLSAEHVRGVLSAMVTAGMYDDSGPWLFRVGLPAKSGVSGGVVAVAPGRLAIAVYSPPLDEKGNSVRATKVIGELSKRWHLHILDPGTNSGPPVRVGGSSRAAETTACLATLPTILGSIGYGSATPSTTNALSPKSPTCPSTLGQTIGF